MPRRKKAELTPEQLGEVLRPAADAIVVEAKKHDPNRLKHLVTRPKNNLSHHITDADLLRIKHSGESKVSPFLEYAIGGTLGAVSAFLISVIKLSGEGLAKIEKDDLIYLIVFSIFLAATIALLIVRPKGKETLDSICDEIKNRKKSDIS